MLTLYPLTYGFVSTYVYYRLYNLNISYFISFEDIFPQIIDSVIITVAGAAIFLLKSGSESTNLLTIKPETKAQKEVYRGFFSEFIKDRRISIIAIACLTVIPLLIFVFYSPNYISILCLTMAIIYAVVFLFATLFLFKKSTALLIYKLKLRRKEWYFNVAVIFLFIVVFSPMKSYVTFINNEVCRNSSSGYTITTNDSVITSTKENFYIGKSSDYVFFFNNKAKVTSAYPINVIKKIETEKRIVDIGTYVHYTRNGVELGDIPIIKNVVYISPYILCIIFYIVTFYTFFKKLLI